MDDVAVLLLLLEPRHSRWYFCKSLTCRTGCAHTMMVVMQESKKTLTLCV